MMHSSCQNSAHSGTSTSQMWADARRGVVAPELYLVKSDSSRQRHGNVTLDTLSSQMWADACESIVPQLRLISKVLNEHSERFLSAVYQEKIANLEKSRANPEICVRIFDSLLAIFPETAKTLQHKLQDDWKNAKTPEGAAIFGYPDYRKPFGLGNGHGNIAGFIPCEMQKLVNRFKKGIIGTIAAGSYKPGTLFKTADLANVRLLTPKCSPQLAAFFQKNFSDLTP